MSTKQLNFKAPPSLAIAEGAITPNPGITGVVCWSTTLARDVVWTGSAWTAHTVNADLVLKANIASPALTGTPLTPTASTADNSTQIASTAFVKAQNYVTATSAPVVSVAGKTGAVTLTSTDVGLANVNNTSDAGKPVSTATQTALNLKQDTSAKDGTGGYAGLTLFKLNLRNAANTITSWFTTAATVARTWTLPDKDGTIAMTSDITGTNSGTNTGDNAVNSNYSGLVSNATHTGDATGSTALAVVKINGTLMSGLATGILKNTTTTGVPSIAVAADFPTLNQSTTGNAGSSTNLSGGTAGKIPYQTAVSTTAFTAAGTNGQVLTSAGVGIPTWQTPSSGAVGGTGNPVFFENDQTVTVDYTLTAGKNAMSAGLITINTGITVTIPTGATWSVV